MEVKTWVDGRLVPCSLEDFTRGLRRFAGWADEKFSVMSDPSAHFGERLNAAADLIDEISKERV